MFPQRRTNNVSASQASPAGLKSPNNVPGSQASPARLKSPPELIVPTVSNPQDKSTGDANESDPKKRQAAGPPPPKSQLKNRKLNRINWGAGEH